MKTNVSPPKLASKLLAWYCQNAMIEDLEGDLEEMFYKNVRTQTARKARYIYWQQVLSLMLSYAIRKRKKDKGLHIYSQNSFNTAMLKNYFIIASRNLAKHKFFTIINVIGLAVGMSISLLIIAMISFVSTYDNFHEQKDSIYRVITFVKDQQESAEYASTPSQLAPHLEAISGVEQVVRINASLSSEATYENRSVPIQGYFADPEFLTLFTFPMVKGNPATALNKPYTVVITERYAQKLFSNEDAIGKIIHTEHFGDFEVTGVFQDVPKNSHMQFEVVASYETLEKSPHIGLATSWNEFRNAYVYFKVNSDDNLTAIENELNNVASKTYTDPSLTATFHLQALPDIEPGMELNNQIGPEWGYLGFSIFGLLTLLILLPACFNYANISISRALKRMKEIGLRKVMGGQQKQIFFQFITETVIVTLIALGLSYLLFTVVKTEFLAMLVDSSSLVLDPDAKTFALFIGFALLVGFGAGFIPALYFARLNPIQALKSKAISQSSRFSFRKIITVAQFALSIGFIMGVVIIYNQYRQVINYNFGFSKENILNVDLQNADQTVFRNEFDQLSTIKEISMSSNTLGTSGMPSVWLQNGDADSIEIDQMFIDEHFITNHDLKLIKGENFSQEQRENVHAIIVNEQFAKQFSDKSQEILGKTFQISDSLTVVVKGVVSDFHYAHLTLPIKSFCFRYDPAQFKVANLHIASSDDIFGTISNLEATWKKLEPHDKFQSKFLSDEINDSYDFYFSMIKICGYLGLLAITISCLGMLGMVVFTVENKVKEIGVRKIMGATTMHITYVLSKDFGRLLLVAAMIATPITYLLFDMYLQRQYVKMNIGVMEIVVSLTLVTGLGLLAILSQTLKAARANPAETLRSE